MQGDLQRTPDIPGVVSQPRYCMRLNMGQVSSASATESPSGSKCQRVGNIWAGFGRCIKKQ